MRSLAGLSPTAEGAALQVLLRRARLGAVRADLRAAGVLPDPHRDRDPRASTPATSRRMSARTARLIELGSGASVKVRILLAALRSAGGLRAGRHLARAAARGRGAAGAPTFPQVAGRRGLRRLHPPVSAAAAARPGRASGSGFSRARRSAISSRTAVVRFLRNCAELLGQRRRDADRRRPEEGAGGPGRRL